MQDIMAVWCFITVHIVLGKQLEDTARAESFARFEFDRQIQHVLITVACE